MKILNQVVKNLFSTKRPAESVEILKGTRPKMPFASERCINCGKCAEICVSNAIAVESRWRIDIGKCISCGNCIGSCEQEAIEWVDAPDYSLSRSGLIFTSGESMERDIQNCLMKQYAKDSEGHWTYGKWTPVHVTHAKLK